ncbi:MAG: Gfo/Idh/MocA family protein [Haloarculaceae archaeon]
MTVRVGICSTAHTNAEVYGSLLSEMPEVDLVGISDENPGRGRQRAAAVGVPLLSRSALFDAADGVLVCSPTVDHEAIFEEAIGDDVAVLTEKPLATTVATARRIRDRASEAGLLAGMAYPIRFSRSMHWARAAYREGRLGDLVAVSAINRGRMPGGWFADPDLAGGGAVMDHTEHIVDTVHWLLDERVVEVYADLATRFHDIPVEDVNLLSMELERGAPFVLDGSWSTPDEDPFWGDATVELVGTDDAIAADTFGQRLSHVQESRARTTESVYWGADPNVGLLRDFVVAIQEHRQPRATLDTGVESVAVMEAAYESAERGEPVDVRY